MQLDIDVLDPAGIVPAGIEPDKALRVFLTPSVFDPFLERVRAAADEFSATATADTIEGREAIAAMARRVAKSRTHIEGVGKKLADVQKDIPRKIDATRKQVREALGRIETMVRAPLDAWEAAERTRIEQHQRTIEFMASALTLGGSPVDHLEKQLAAVEAVEIGPDCEDFVDEYTTAKAAALAFLPLAIAEARKREAEAAELVRLRAADAERQKLDREADIAAETERRVREQADAAAATEALEAARRAADVEHQATINRAAMAAFVSGGIPEEHARKAVAMIACRKIPAVSIRY